MNRFIVLLSACAGLALLLAAGCHHTEGYNPNIDPANFVDRIDNAFSPMTPGTTWHYLTYADPDTEINAVSVIAPTKEILGVTCTIVWDRVWDVDSDLVEETFDWYAQDKQGNVWYFGEDAKEYESGHVVSTAGSWQAGVDGAKPGMVMEGSPQVGDTYRQEYYAGKAEDKAAILSLSESATVPYGSFTDCVKTQDWSALEPDVIENKWFASGVGNVLTTTVQGGTERTELVAVTSDTSRLRR